MDVFKKKAQVLQIQPMENPKPDYIENIMECSHDAIIKMMGGMDMINQITDISEINQEKIINQIRSLGIDMIYEAQSGHPGIVLGAAPIIYTLYAHHLRIDPKNPNGDYCPENCTWITMKDQAENKTSTNWIRYNGYEFPESIWEKITGIHRATIHYRYFKLGWSSEKTLRTPGGCSKKTKKYLVWDVPPEYLKYQKSF